MLWTCLSTSALTGVSVEDVVEWAGGSRQGANTLAGVTVEMLVGAAALSVFPASTRTLTGFNIQLLIWTAHICREYVKVLLGGPWRR